MTPSTASGVTSCEHVVSLELLEKVVLTGLVTFIFSRMLPGADPAAIDIMVGVAVVVVLDTLISRLLILRGDRPHGAVLQFAVTLAVNLAIVAVAFAIGTLSGVQIQHAIVFVLLISVIVTGYDRYRPLYKARFANGPLRGAGLRRPAKGQATGVAGAGKRCAT